VFETPHGRVETPTFMPVGTQGSVKTLTPDEVASTGAQIVLGNTYHLMLRPGAEVVSALGGLRAFTRWPHAMLTDSGGFQAYSLRDRGVSPKANRAKVEEVEAGFAFRSHIDGSAHQLTPEGAVLLQGQLGADIQMQLDVCPEGGAERSVVEAAVRRTTRWAKRALAVIRPEGQALFGIVQGACFLDLRKAHAAELGELGFDGLAIGGFSVGEPIEQMHETLAEIAPALDPDRPRYLMGVGSPRDLVLGMAVGIDMFDCVMPTRNARNGQAFTRFGRMTIKNARWQRDSRPIDERCRCACCASGYSRGYLRHLFLAREILCLRLLSLHNLHWYGELTRAAREAITEGRFASWAGDVLASIHGDDAVDDPT
jgi:queuine tRNA-ribosyltransferase